MQNPTAAAIQRILTTLERELNPLGVSWSILALTAEDRRRWTMTLRIGRVDGVTITGSPAELAPQLRGVLRTGQLPCPACRTRQDLLTRSTPTWNCACGTTFYHCTWLEPEDPAWDTFLDRLEPLIPEDLRDSVLDLLEASSRPEEFFTGIWEGHPFDTTLYAVTQEVAFREIRAMPSRTVLKLASDRLGLRQEPDETTPLPSWQSEREDWVLRWQVEPSLTLTVFGGLLTTGGWTRTPAAVLTWIDPIPGFASLDEAVRWLDARLQDALQGGPAGPA